MTTTGWNLDALDDCLVGNYGARTPYAFAASDAGDGHPTFLAEWRANRALPHGGALTGYGFGSDVNGLGPQAPRLDSAARPLTYPFTAPTVRR